MTNCGDMRGPSAESQAPETCHSMLGRFRSLFGSKSSGSRCTNGVEKAPSGGSDVSAKAKSCWGFVLSRSTHSASPSIRDSLVGTSEEMKLQQSNTTRSRARADQVPATAKLFSKDDSNTSQDTNTSHVRMRKASLIGLWEYRRCSDPGLSSPSSALSPAMSFRRRFSDSAGKGISAGSFYLNATFRNVPPPKYEGLLQNLGAALESDLNDPLIFGRGLDSPLTQEDYTFFKKSLNSDVEGVAYSWDSLAPQMSLP